MCGEHACCPSHDTLALGSSPHVRGARYSSLHICRISGIIPACAGSTRSSTSLDAQPADHPRMCGEHPATV